MIAGMRSEALKGHVETMLLAALQGSPAHGYELAVRLRGVSAGTFDLGEGTLYGALHRLERDGLVASSWSTVEGRRRRVYALTRSGLRALAERRREWRSFADGMHLLLEGSA
jgi:PadR family transcriptional regulator, regulatory protein PadR